jgi:hypothetical protein
LQLILPAVMPWPILLANLLYRSSIVIDTACSYALADTAGRSAATDFICTVNSNIIVTDTSICSYNATDTACRS